MKWPMFIMHMHNTGATSDDIGPGQCQIMLTGVSHIQDSTSQPVTMHQQPASITVAVHT